MDILVADYKGKTVYIVGVAAPIGVVFVTDNGEQLGKYSVKLYELKNIRVQTK